MDEREVLTELALQRGGDTYEAGVGDANSPGHRSQCAMPMGKETSPFSMVKRQK